jgi:hypothetical protein
MNNRKVLTALAAVLAFCLNVVVFAAPTKETPLPPPFNPKMGMSGICGDQHYLYVMVAGLILQYELSSMKLLNTVELPDVPPPPGGHPPRKNLSKKTHPGLVVYLYSLPDLKLDLTREFPKPDLPPPPAGG